MPADLPPWLAADPLIPALLRAGIGLDEAAEIAERAAIFEHDAGKDRVDAEVLAVVDSP